MITLPKNEKTQANKTPKTYLIFGKNMSGKSYFADQFPDALTLSTDGNAKRNGVPNIVIENVLDANGKVVKNAFDQVEEILLTLKNTKHEYKTLIIDQIEGILNLFESAITKSEGVRTLADIPYGKGYSLNNAVVRDFLEILATLPMYVVFISHEQKITDPTIDKDKLVPMLSDRQYSQVAKSADLVIQTQKIGQNYIRRVVDRRTNYVPTEIKSPQIAQILSSVTGVFDKTTPTTKAKQDEIVEKIQDNESVIENVTADEKKE